MIRRLLKWFLYLGLLLLAALVALILAKDTLIRNLTERRIIQQTGLYVRIDRMHVGFTEPVISLQNFKLYNRPEFGGGLLLHLQELHLEYDPEKLRSGQLHLDRLRLDLRELNIVRNATGHTNLTDFLDRTAAEGRAAWSRRLPARQFGFTGIDTLDLSLGRIRFIDLGNPRRTREARFDVEHLEIKNIRNEDDLYGVAGLVLVRGGLVHWAEPDPHPPAASAGLLEMVWEELRDHLRRAFGEGTRPATNPPPARTQSPTTTRESP